MAVAKLQDHLQKHDDYYDPAIKRNSVLLLGEKGDNGLCSAMKEIQNGYATMKYIGIAILIALLVNIIVPFVK
jgi:hypothetical protein